MNEILFIALFILVMIWFSREGEYSKEIEKIEKRLIILNLKRKGWNDNE